MNRSGITGQLVFWKETGLLFYRVKQGPASIARSNKQWVGACYPQEKEELR